MLSQMTHKLESRLLGENINSFRYADDTTLMGESVKVLKSLLMREKGESEKSGLKLNIQKPKIMASSPITAWQTDRGTMERVTDFIFLDSKITVDGDCSCEIKRCLLLGGKAITNLKGILRSRNITFADKDPYSQSYGFSSRQVWLWGLDHKEGWALKNWCFRIVVLEKTLEKNPLDCKEIISVHPKGNQSWILTGRTDKAEAPILWPPDAKSQLTGKDPATVKDWKQKEKRAVEDEMVK